MSVNKVKKANVYSIEGTEKGSMEVPAIFLSNIRSDIINKIVKVMESNARVPYAPWFPPPLFCMFFFHQ